LIEQELSIMQKKMGQEVSPNDDLALVRCAKGGDVAAFEELIRRNTERILRIAVRITGSYEDGEEVVQDASLQAFRHLGRFEERARFSTWLTRIVINAAFMKLRARRRTFRFSADERAEGSTPLVETLVDRRPSPEHDYGASELRLALQKALVDLPHGQRVVFLMRDVEGLSTLDTADMLELSVPSVKSRLLRARLKLRKSLHPYSIGPASAPAPSLRIQQAS
jgi:RNA polymerase sigma-70 factor, ECF subfamily